MFTQEQELMADTIAFRSVLSKILNEEDSDVSNGVKHDGGLQKVHTPFGLCLQMVKKAMEYGELKGNILCFNLEFVEVLVYSIGIERGRIWFCSDCDWKLKLLEFERYKGVNGMTDKELDDKNAPRKFSCVFANPPYQTKSNKGDKKTQTIWPNFEKTCFEVCEDGGMVVMVHPSGWRDVDGMLKDAQELLKSKDVKYLEMHDEKDGQKTFGATTPYDYYVAKNQHNQKKTNIVGQDGKTATMDISVMEFIPNGKFEDIERLLAKVGEEKVTIINNSSYHHQRDYVVKTQDEEFKYPSIYNRKKK